MDNKLAVFISFGAVIIILVLGGALFFSLYKKSATTDSEVTDVQQSISLEQVQAHATQDDCWTYIGGQVFDATAIIRQHPDKAAILVKACGTDGTKIYTIQKYSEQSLDKQTITTLRDQLSAYQVGYLSP